MEHRRDRQHRVPLADAKRIRHGFGKRMENDGAMRVDNPLGKTRRAGSKAHGRAFVFIDGRQVVIRRSGGKELFIIYKTGGNGVATVGYDDDFFEWRIRPEFLQHRQQHIVNNQKSIRGMPRNRRDLLRMQPQIQRM